MATRSSQYKHYTINLKQLLSALWTSVLFLYIYGDYFELYVPEKVAYLLDGKNLLNTPLKLFLATVSLTIPSLMIFLTLIVNPKWNRILNISTGIFLTFFTCIVSLSSFTEWRIFYLMLSILESIITSIIIWKAWNWPKS